MNLLQFYSLMIFYAQEFESLTNLNTLTYPYRIYRKTKNSLELY